MGRHFTNIGFILLVLSLIIKCYGLLGDFKLGILFGATLVSQLIGVVLTGKGM